jgi:hypothetical protein
MGLPTLLVAYAAAMMPTFARRIVASGRGGQRHDAQRVEYQRPRWTPEDGHVQWTRPRLVVRWHRE